MKEKIESAIKETLVVQNSISIYRCVDKIMKIIEQEKQNKKNNV